MYHGSKDYSKNTLISQEDLRSVGDRNVGRVSASNQPKINKVVDLYEDKRISHFGTVECPIRNIATRSGKQRNKGLKEYDKAVAKYEEAEAVPERRLEALKRA